MGGYWKSGLIAISVLAVIAGGAWTSPAQQAAPSARAPRTAAPSQRQVDPSVAERLKAVMVPLLQHMDRPIPLNQMILLNQVFPSTSAITPIAGQLIANSYSRKEEYQADAHGVEILQRAGYNGRGLMAETLTWLKGQEASAGRGGFFATHPATGDRVGAVRRLPDRARTTRQ